MRGESGVSMGLLLCLFPVFPCALPFAEGQKFSLSVLALRAFCGVNFQRCVRSCCEFQSVYTIEF